MVKDLRRSAADPDYPPVLFFHMGEVREGERFFEDHWPEARAVADPERFFYDVFGRRRGGAREFLAPRVWLGTARALLKGNFAGRPVGDVRVMPGLFLVCRERILWEHPFESIADHPEFRTLGELAGRLMREGEPGTTST